jgi:hypothetical protein
MYVEETQKLRVDINGNILNENDGKRYLEKS